MSEFAPAPWRWSDEPEREPEHSSAVGWVHIDGEGSIVDANGDTVLGAAEYNDLAFLEPNGTLILAAPDLYVALKAAVDKVNSSAGPLPAWWKPAMIALAKARGQA